MKSVQSHSPSPTSRHRTNNTRKHSQSRSRSRSRSNEANRGHNNRDYKERTEKSKQKETMKHSSNKEKEHKDDHKHETNEHDDDNNKNNSAMSHSQLIAKRSASVLRTASILRSQSVFRGPSMLRSAKQSTLPSLSSNNRMNRTISNNNSNSNPRPDNDSNNNSNKNVFAKPRFLTREEREQLALQRLKQKRSEQKDRLLKAKEEREHLFNSKQRAESNNNNNNTTDSNNNNNTNTSNSMNIDSVGTNDTDALNNMSRVEAREFRAKERQIKKLEEAKEKELTLIKEAYLGKKKTKKSVIPPSQKFKFNFDWEPEEDTSEDVNELYTKPAKIALRFGRGYLAGIDRDEQIKNNKALWRGLIRSRRTKVQYEDDDLSRQLEEKRRKRQEKETERQKIERMEARNWRDKSIEEMTERDWRILKEEFRISTKFGGRLPNPVRFWNECCLPDSLLRAIKEVAKYDEPSPIQRMAIPVGLTNRDCVGIAETGSGKTAAFVLPMLTYLLKQPPMSQANFEDGPYAIVLAPTRELAKQIEDETNKFATFIEIHAITIVGGISLDTQSVLLRDGVECIIATPGRLNDCIERRILVLNQCNYVVLDEADRMIDMGFEPQVLAIFEKMPTSNMRPLDESKVEENRIYRQTFMFSATMPPAVERLTRQYLRNPVYITIGDPNATAAERVRQHIIWLTEPQKRKKLMELLPNMEPPIMIFCNQKKNADTLAKFLRSQNLSAISLHGGKSQENREYSLLQFRNKEIDVLVCTNVAGRGIDVEGVQHVVNYDMPNNIQDYCHRIGRTGRAGNEGVATSFLTKDDTDIMYELKKMLLKTNNVVPNELMQHEAAMRDPKTPFSEAQTTKQILAKVKPV